MFLLIQQHSKSLQVAAAVDEVLDRSRDANREYGFNVDFGLDLELEVLNLLEVLVRKAHFEIIFVIED